MGEQERRQGFTELHDDLRKVLEKTTRIETALWPDPGQPSTITRLDTRVGSLESAKAWAIGAFAGLTGLFGIHLFGHHK
jgi:hypothetical protein